MAAFILNFDPGNLLEMGFLLLFCMAYQEIEKGKRNKKYFKLSFLDQFLQTNWIQWQILDFFREVAPTPVEALTYNLA